MFNDYVPLDTRKCFLVVQTCTLGLLFDSNRSLIIARYGFAFRQVCVCTSYPGEIKCDVISCFNKISLTLTGGKFDTSIDFHPLLNQRSLISRRTSSTTEFSGPRTESIRPNNSEPQLKNPRKYILCALHHRLPHFNKDVVN